MKSNRYKNKKKEELISEDMPNGRLVVIGIILFILLFIPAKEVLTLQIKVSENKVPELEDIQIFKEKISYASYFARQTSQVNIIGNIDVKIVVKNPSNDIIFNQTYYLSAGTFTIKTPSPISVGYTVEISISKLNYQRSIKIG